MKNKKTKSPASNYSSEVYAKMKKYQKQYGFEIGNGEHDASFIVDTIHYEVLGWDMKLYIQNYN